MSLLRKSDYVKESKKNNTVSPRRGTHGGVGTSKKIKLPTQYKTIKHNCSQCIRTDAAKYHLTEKEVRWLCPDCKIRNSRREIPEKPNFLRASKLGAR